MGCDIHAVVEVKINPHNMEGWWINAGEIHINRDYRLFAKLAGVRNEHPWLQEPIAEPRGIPTDASGGVDALVEAWGHDGHSHSWVTVGELVGITDQQLIPAARRIAEKIDALEKLHDAIASRLVFFFDN